MVRDGEDPTEINALAILGADPDVRELASLERLRLAAKVAQAERNMNEKTRARRWTKDSGETITHGELISELNKAQKIEIDVAPLPVKEQARVMARQGMSIKAIVEALGIQGIDVSSRQVIWKMVRDILAERTAPCAACGVEMPRRGSGRPTHCYECRHPLCEGGCGERGPRGCMTPSAVAQRGGRAWRCQKCSAALWTPEQKSEAVRKGRADMTSEQRSAIARKAAAARSHEERCESMRRAQYAQQLTPKQRAKKASDGMSREQRAERMRKLNATREARRAAQ